MNGGLVEINFFTCVLSGSLIVYMTHMHRIAAATATL